MILIMYSGGLDSTAALWKLLTEGTDDVYIHHINLLNSENRDKAEQEAVNNIVHWLHGQKLGVQFYTSQNTLDWSFLPDAPMDYMIISHTAAQICLKYNSITHVAIGLENDPDEHWYHCWTHGRQLFNQHFQLTDYIPEWIFPTMNMTRKQEFEYLPKELYNLTWSCRTPKFDEQTNKFNKCGVCRPCEKFSEEKFESQQWDSYHGPF